MVRNSSVCIVILKFATKYEVKNALQVNLEGVQTKIIQYVNFIDSIQLKGVRASFNIKINNLSPNNTAKNTSFKIIIVP